MGYKDPEKRKAAARRWYEAHREEHIQRAAAYRHGSAEARDRWRQWKRNHRQKHGAIPLAEKQARKAERDARAAVLRAQRAEFRQWSRETGSSDEVSAYYAQIGKPWLNPRLAESDRAASRYAADAAFHSKELARLKRKKRRHRAEIAESTVDVTPAEVRQLLEAATECSYCGCALDSDNRTLDHIVPLSRGGLHQRSNVTPACRPCNSAKQDRLDWGKRQGTSQHLLHG